MGVQMGMKGDGGRCTDEINWLGVEKWLNLNSTWYNILLAYMFVYMFEIFHNSMFEN